jgi:UDP-2-acetamido-3-amino-2,3-dideoxy-glucuronate N-acetyltransferase
MGSDELYIHDSAVVDDGAKIGTGTKVWHFTHVMSDATIGENCILGQNVYIDNGVEIGNNVKIQNNVSVYQGVTLEDGVFCGPSMVFTNVNQPRSDFPKDEDEYETTLVGRGCTIGANATIVCGNDLGAWSFVGAGAVVTDTVTDHALMYGNPATQEGWVCTCGKIKLW